MLGQNTDLEHRISISVDGKPIEIINVDLVEFSFGELVKMYPSESVKYEEGVFLVHLTQEETVSFGSSISVQVRVKFSNNNVVLTKAKTMPVNQALSKAVL